MRIKRATGVALLAALAMTTTACGSETGATSDDAATPSGASATAEKKGSGVSDDCQVMPVGRLLQLAKKANYTVALVTVTSLGEPIARDDDGIKNLYTPVSVTYDEVLSGSVRPDSTLFVTGGETVDYSTTATGPIGVALNQQALVMVPPDGARESKPNGFIETSLAVDGKFAIGDSRCLSGDLPQSQQVQTSVKELVTGKERTSEIKGIRIPLTALRGALKPS